MLTAGAATRVINNDLGTVIQGAGVDQTVQSIRDNLEANVLYLSDGTVQLLLISCDLVGFQSDTAASLREAVAASVDVPEDAIVIAGTHMHSGPSVIRTKYSKQLDTAYLTRLHTWLANAASEAVGAARPARIGWGSGRAQIGYNRRACWRDGHHSLGGDAKSPDFTGLEGPDDPTHTALFVEGMDESLLAILHHNTSHPTTFYGANFLSADYPGEARRMLRNVLGDLPVLYFNGAIGDIGPECLLAQRPWGESGDQKVARQGQLVAAETLRLRYSTPTAEAVPLAHALQELPLDVRLPDKAAVEEGRSVLARIDAGEDVPAGKAMHAFGSMYLWDAYGHNPVDQLRLHAFRIGDLAIFTQPCELFCAFALEIRRRSPFPITAVVSVTDGYGGYCPTMSAIIGGGYSGVPYHWSRLTPEAGDRIVDAASRMLHEIQT